MNNKFLGWLLIGLSFLVISGFVVKQGIYWEIIDVIVIVACVVAGVNLLKKS
ncbi:MAG: hypothetical protein ABIH56_01005 [Candidatus Margulisiibacteriota bacterium]